jgi:hypothetical protein
MKIMLDCSPDKIAEYSRHYGYDFWQLRTPLTKYALAGVPYGLDNGCFGDFREDAWNRLLDEAYDDAALVKFVCLPDLVGDARRTLDLFEAFKVRTNGLPRALVLQDGIGGQPIPFDDIAAVFVGGSDAFKTSREAWNACRAAQMLGKWIHVGRVNTIERVRHWLPLADSIDGSGISRFDHMLEAVLHAIRNDHPQIEAVL